MPLTGLAGGSALLQVCSCSGTAYYGRKYQDTTAPGSGTVATFQEMLETPYVGRYVDGTITCAVSDFGADPMLTYTKGCWCVPAEEITLCSAVDGPVSPH